MPTRVSTKPKVFRKDIQALRAIAVIAVIVYHLWPNRLVGGFIGVDIFFVISGYLMTLSVMHRLTPLVRKKLLRPRQIGKLLVDFYARRIKRLVPAALATLLGVLGLTYLTGNLSALITNAKNTLSAATFWQNWLLAKDSVDYLQQDNAVVATQHFWSLSLEEQFYLIWPLLLIIGTLLTINIVVLYKRSRIAGVILPITLLTLLSLAYGIWLTNSDATVAYYATPARIWELMVGGIIALLPAIKNYDLKLLLPYAGLAIIAYSLAFIGIEDFPGWIAIIPVIGTALIIHAGIDRAESALSFERAFRWRPVQWIGDISYSLYLWHFPFVILLPIILHQSLIGPHGRLLKVGIIILTFIVAHLSYRLIEQPFQKAQFKNRTIYIGFVLATGLVVALSYGTKQHAEASIDTSLATMHAEAADTGNKCFGARAILHEAECGDPYGQLNPAYASVAKQDHFRDIIQDDRRRCDNFRPDKDNRDDPTYHCVYGDETADRSIILIGDSHADQYINAFNDIGERHHYKILQFSTLLCFGEIDDPKQQKLCEQRNDVVTNRQTLDDSSLIVVSLLFRSSTQAKTEQLLDALYANTDTPIALLNDSPHSLEDRLSACYTTNAECELGSDQATKSSYRPFAELAKKSRSSRRTIAQINVDKAFCDGDECYSSIGGVPVYYDTSNDDGTLNSHITASYALSMAPLIERNLEQYNLL